jgi:hypothetical protein
MFCYSPVQGQALYYFIFQLSRDFADNIYDLGMVPQNTIENCTDSIFSRVEDLHDLTMYVTVPEVWEF